MRRFSSFVQALNESVNSPIEFDLTDDTQLPYRIYAVFKQDDDLYGMSLEQSDFAGIFILDFYRITSKQKRLWSFKKQSHILPGLSTLIKFAEAVMPFVKTKMKGIMIKIPGDKAERYIRFGTRLIKKSYIKTFRVLPVTKSPDKKIYNWELMFLSKVGVSPSSVFADSKFKKYGFSTDILTHEAADTIEPIKPPKTVLRTTPSRKYKIGALSTDFELSDDLFTNISNIEEIEYKAKTEKIKLPEEDFNKYGLRKNVNIFIHDILGFEDDKIIKEELVPFLQLVKEKPALALYAILHKYKHKSKNSITEILDTKWEFQDFLQFNADLPIALIQPFYLDGFSTSSRRIAVSEQLYTDVLFLHSNNKVPESQIVDEIEKINKYLKATGDIYINLGNVEKLVKPHLGQVKTKVTSIDPVTLTSTLSGMGGFNYEGLPSALLDGNGGSNEEFDSDKAVQAIEETLGYKKQINDLPNKVIESVRSYTGSSYGKINNSLRYYFNDFMEYGSSDETINLAAFDIHGAVETMEPLKEPFWVYRSTSLPDSVKENITIGGDFMDPAILSTTINPKMIFDAIGDRFRIFLPVGSKVIPILSNSRSPSENEIILPAMSVIKIIRIDEFESTSRSLYTGIYVGSAFNDFMKMNNLKLNESKIEQHKETEKYDPKMKYAGTTDPKTLSNAAKFIEQMKKKQKK